MNFIPVVGLSVFWHTPIYNLCDSSSMHILFSCCASFFAFQTPHGFSEIDLYLVFLALILPLFHMLTPSNLYSHAFGIFFLYKNTGSKRKKNIGERDSCFREMFEIGSCRLKWLVIEFSVSPCHQIQWSKL